MEELSKDLSTLSSTQHPHPQPTIHRTPHHEFLASPIYASTQSSDDLKASSKHVTSHNNPSLLQQPECFGTCPCSNYMTSTPRSFFSSSLLPPLGLRKREAGEENGGGGGDSRRYKRKMKNRESALRSRARRQAYTTVLETEVAQLREENAMLRKRQEEMSSAAAAAAALAQVPKKSRLPRCLTAPF